MDGINVWILIHNTTKRRKDDNMTKTKKKFNRHEIYGILRDYHWLVKEVDRLIKELNVTESVGVASYSDEPRGGGGPSKPIESEVIRREKKYDRMKRYLMRVDFINEKSANITDEREKVILDCILDGMRMSAVASHLGISRHTANQIRDIIVVKLDE